MEACGLIVEYNPFHNGHHYHLTQSQETSKADCMVAVMSGNFLQRGEPAIMDKFHRAKLAIQQGVDIVIELPYAYAVQNSDLFAKGAVLSLGALGVSSLCFGSEHGDADSFIKGYHTFSHNIDKYETMLKNELKKGLSFPQASRNAYYSIGLKNDDIDLSRPNNILGFSYVKNIFQLRQSITPLTIKRIKNDYHDQEIKHPIASATSVRNQIIKNQRMTTEAKSALPLHSQETLQSYLNKAGYWHNWEHYFQYLYYKITTMTEDELRNIHGVDEGLEYRLKKTITEASDFESWMNLLKTKRYTWTRIQRTLVHILVNCKKETILQVQQSKNIPYIRLLGLSKKGQAYLREQKKDLHVPIIAGLTKEAPELLRLDERATDAYYSILKVSQRKLLRKQEFGPPFMLKD